MNHRTAKDRLLENLPPEQRSNFDRCLHRLSTNPDDPLIALFAIITESDKNSTVVIESKLAAFEQQEKRRDDQHVKERTENTKTILQKIDALIGTALWKRIIASKIIGGGIWFAIVLGLTPYYVKKQVRTVDPVFHQRLETVESEIKKRIDDRAQFQNLRNDQVIDLIRETNEKIRETRETIDKTHVTTASQTLLGKGLSRYVSSFNETTITIGVNGRSITVAHNLTPVEYLQLQIAYDIAKNTQMK